MKETLKRDVQRFWDQASCGEVYARGATPGHYYDSHARARDELEPYLAGFAEFAAARNKDVLEIGVGMGADHVRWANTEARSVTGIDLSARAIEHTHKRLAAYALQANLSVADAEALPFKDHSFDLIYSWGVLHHSPNTSQAIAEIFRVLRPQGRAKIMLYHKYSLTGYMLWMRYALLRARPFRSLNAIYYHHLESPGTQAYSLAEAEHLFNGFSHRRVKIQLSFADLLYGSVGQKHERRLVSLAKKLWPRPLLKALCKNHGLLLLIEAEKSC